MLERPPFTCASWSVASDGHPQRNEDTLVADPQRGLVAVFDGVGGSAAGEVASGIAGRVIEEGWQRQLEQAQPEAPTTLLTQCDALDLPATLKRLLQEAHEHIRTAQKPASGAGAQRGNEDQATTVALAVFCRQEDTHHYRMVYASVGDSRIYLLRPGEPLICLTEDDSFLNQLLQDDLISEEEAQRIDQASRPEELSSIELAYFGRRNAITQALGDAQSLSIHLGETAIGSGDRILLCTDGVHDNLTDAEIKEFMAHEPDPQQAQQLVEYAQQRSRRDRNIAMRAKPDDISAIIMICNE